MRIHFRTYCYGCRRGRQNGRCIWRAHRWEWDYFIECGGRRLVTRQGFKDIERARVSAERSWHKLHAIRCAAADGAS